MAKMNKGNKRDTIQVDIADARKASKMPAPPPPPPYKAPKTRRDGNDS